MTQVWVVLILAFAAANLPFLLDRRLLVLPVGKDGKNAGWSMLELVLLYFVVGGIAWLVERNIGPVQHQNWEFYATTGCLFLVFAFPGFVYRHLWRKRGA